MPVLLREEKDSGASPRSVPVNYSSCYDEDLPLVFRKPCWQLYTTLISTLITPLLYRVYLILVTIGWALFSNGTSGSYTNPHVANSMGVARVPEVDLSWTGLLLGDPTWRGSAASVVVLSFCIVSFYSLAIVWLLRFKPRRTLVIKIVSARQAIYEVPPNGLQRWRHEVECVRRVFLTPVLNVCLLVMLHLLLLRSGDVESNPGPFGTMPLTLGDLGDVYETVYSVQPKWYNFGLALELPAYVLDSIRIKYREDPSDCLREMLKARLKIENKLTCRDIIRALRKPTVGGTKLADQLEQVYDPQEASSAKETVDKQTEERIPESQDEAGPAKTIQKSSSIEMYQTYLKGVYSVKQLPVDEKYPIDCVKHFVNLECADVRKHLTKKEAEEFRSCIIRGDIESIRKERITMEQVAAKQDDSYPKLVLVKGAPGVGKTTFSWELCRSWSAGKLLNDYSLVVLLRLRDENVQEAKTLADLFQCGDDSLSTEFNVGGELGGIHGKGVLFILEGLDELPGNVREDKNSIFMKLITGRLLPASTVMVTTRPWAVADLPKSCKSRVDQHIEILGFNKEQINEYVDHMIKDGVPEGLRTYISANPHISSAVYNPLHARIVVEVYREYSEENKSIFPNTTTELYTAYSNIIIHSYLIDHPADQHWNGDLRALPPSIEPHFIRLCKAAYEGITKEKQQLVFSKQDIPDGGFTTLGFMNSVQPLHQTVTKATSPSYNFLHFTLQEYFAAVYIWKNHTPEQHMILFETESNNGTYNMILTFLAGLTKFEDEYTRCVLPVPFLESQAVPSGSLRKTLIFSCKHILWLYESQNVSTFHGDAIAVFLLGGLLRFESPRDYFALGYCIASSNYPLELTIDMNMDQEKFAMLIAGAMKCSSSVAKLKHLTLHLSDMNPEAELLLFTKFFKHISVDLEVFLGNFPMVNLLPESLLDLLRMSRNLKNVELCQLSLNDVSQESVTSMFKILGSKPCLKIFTFTLGTAADFDILSNLIVNSSSLKTLVLKLPLFGRQRSAYHTVTFGFNIDQLKQHHPVDNPPLTASIFCVESDISGYGVQQRQFLNEHVLTQDTVKRIAGVLKHFPHSLELLNLDGCGLDSEGCNELANSITACSSLKDLHVSMVTSAQNHAHSDTNGLQAMAPLNGHKPIQTLHEIDRSECLFQLLPRLDRHPSLRKLVIKRAVIRKREAEILAVLLCNNQTLEAIELSMFESMKENDLELIMDALQSNSYLKRLIIMDGNTRSYFHGAYINQDGARSIARMLETNKTLEYFKFSYETRSSVSVVQSIAQAVSMNTTLKTLSLHYVVTENSQAHESALGYMLAKNTSLQVLCLIIPGHTRYSALMKGLAVNKTLQELCLLKCARYDIIRCPEYVANRYRIKFDT